MNAVFTFIVIASALVIAIAAPEKLLPSLLGGAESSLKTALTLFCIYAVWMGLSRLAEKSRLSETAARAALPLARKVFKTDNPKAAEYLAMNLSCNLIGIGGAATPYAVKAIGELEKDGNEFAQKLLFIINATSIQLVPTTVITLRAAAGSIAPSDIFLPSLICTFVSTAAGVTLYLLYVKLTRGKIKAKTSKVSGGGI